MLEVCIIFHLPACLVVQHEGGCMHALSLTEQVEKMLYLHQLHHFFQPFC